MRSDTDPASPARQHFAEPGGGFDLTPTDEQQMLVQSAREVALNRLRPAAHDADSACGTPATLVELSNELGVGLLGVPEAHGGITERRSAVTAALLHEALAEGDMGIAVACMAPGAVATALGLWGNATQQAAYLPAFASSAPPCAALAVMEPQILFDPFALRTRARRTTAGDFVLDGVKSLVPRGSSAELLVVAAMLGEHPAMFLVETATGGIDVHPEPAMGLRAAATARIVLESVTVPDGSILGDPGSSAYTEAIALGRLAWSALAAGTSRAVLDYVSQYVNQRVAFGEPISNRQSVAFAVADVAIELDGLRLTTLRGAALADTGREFAREATLARMLAAEYGAQIGSTGVQLLGGHGYTHEHPVERWYRDLRAAGMIEGTLLL